MGTSLLNYPASAPLVGSSMNSFHFSLLFTASLLISLSDGLITPIVSGINIYLPLIGAASTAGLGTILAAIGALKLGAAAVFLASQSNVVEDEAVAGGYGAPDLTGYEAPVEQVDTYGAPLAEAVDTYGAPAAETVDTYGAPSLIRKRRTASQTEADSMLGLVESLDQSNCAKQLVCQINAKNVEERTPEESVIIAMFGKQYGGASKLSMAEFEFAAKIGATSGSELVCQDVYSSCPYSAKQILALFKSL